MIRWLALLVGSITLIACSSSDDSYTPGSGLDISSYFDQQSDVITFNDHFEATYSNGERASGDSIKREYYGLVSTIPSKYSYNGAISAPYILRVDTEDGEIDGFEYSSMLDEEIIEDDLDTFKRIDARTKTGTDEPENLDAINIGDEFTFEDDSTLFDSKSAQVVGNEQESGTLTVSAFEPVSVPAGNYNNAVKINFVMNKTTTLRNITDTSDFQGSGWFDATTGLMLKLTGTLTLTLNEYGLTASGASDITSTAPAALRTSVARATE